MEGVLDDADPKTARLILSLHQEDLDAPYSRSPNAATREAAREQAAQQRQKRIEESPSQLRL